jgi:hypothetical protein
VKKPLIELVSGRVHRWTGATVARVRDGLARRGDADAERGDVPGWVLVTLMTAGLVIALWAIAGPALTSTFTNAINSVKGP